MVGNLVYLLVRKRSCSAGAAHISFHAQFRSEARMFEHGMMYRGLPQAGGHSMLCDAGGAEAAVASVGFV